MKEAEQHNFEIMNYKELSVYLKLSPNTLRHKVMQGKIPFYKIDGAVRFSKKDIDVWLEEHYRKTIKPKAENHRTYIEFV